MNKIKYQRKQESKSGRNAARNAPVAVVAPGYKDMQADNAGSVAFAEWGKTNPEELDSEDNLMPACRICNHCKSASGTEGFRKKLKKQLTRSSVASFQTRLAINMAWSLQVNGMENSSLKNTKRK